MNILASSSHSVGPTTDDWQAILKSAFRHPATLAKELQLPASAVDRAIAAHADFRTFAPQPFVDLIQRGQLGDPLLRQIWPTDAELVAQPNELVDPVGDEAAQTAPGVLQKYRGRALLILSGACAIHCRYCFRRNWPYTRSPGSLRQWENPLAEIAQDASIREVILSGGDPLMWNDDRLAQLVERIERIEHVKRLRLHTRMPAVLPQRVSGALLDAIACERMQVVVVIHSNHPRELSPRVQAALAEFAHRRILLLNQSVLLNGVNDDAETLIQLSERLIECGVVPYYLHQLDRVIGSSHFEVPIERGRALLNELRQRLPGYMVPRYVQEVPGHSSKMWID